MPKEVRTLNLSYEFSSDKTTQEYLDKVTSLRHGLLLETLEAFGSYMGDSSQKILSNTEYEFFEGQDVKLKETKTKDDITLGILKYSKTLFAGGGANAKWRQAVHDIADWYVHNVTAYSQPTLTFCGLVGKAVRWDCSGFVTACLQRFGALTSLTWPPRSGDYASNDFIGSQLSSAGFKKYVFSWETVKPYDIIVYNGHIEIYNDLIDGKRTSWAWGAYHPSLPCGTAHQALGYDYIWRCEGGGILSSLLHNMTIAKLSPGETGISNEMLNFISQQETGHPFGYRMTAKDLNGYDLKDANGHLTYGYGLLYHPNGKFMDSIKRTWTQQELESLYLQHVKSMSSKIDKWASSKGIKLHQQQKDAICSACFNFGAGFLNKPICGLIAQNPSDSRIPDTWRHLSDKQGVKYPGLIKRRNVEANWWMTGHA